MSSDVQQDYWLHRELSVTENSVVPTITSKKAASSQLVTAGLPVTDFCRLQRIAGGKVRWTESFCRKIAVYSQRNTSEVTRLSLEHQATKPADLPRD